MENTKKVWIKPFFLLMAGLLFHTLICDLMYWIATTDYFSGYHTGSGAWNFASDSTGYHKHADRIADLLPIDGIIVWWRENGWWHVNVISIFYFIFGHHAPAFIPMNSIIWVATVYAVYSTACVLCSENKKYPIIIAAIFGLWPSYLFHTTQLMKDPFYVMGLSFLLLGLVRLLCGISKKSTIAYMLTGLFLCMVVRSYIFALFFWISVMMIFVATIKYKEVRVVGLVSIILFIPLYSYYGYFYRNTVPMIDVKDMHEVTLVNTVKMITVDKKTQNKIIQKEIVSTQEMAVEGKVISDVRAAINPEVIEQQKIDFQKFLEYQSKVGLEKSKNNTKLWSFLYGSRPWGFIYGVPDRIEFLVKRVIERRKASISDFMAAGSNIDLYATFYNVADVVKYLPRVFQIGYLGPFPSFWLTNGSEVSTERSTMRTVVGGEMIMLYFLLIGFVVFMLNGKTSFSVKLCLLIFTVPALVLTTYAVINLGALHRMRYGYLLPIFVGGAYGWMLIMAWFGHIIKRLHESRLVMQNAIDDKP